MSNKPILFSGQMVRAILEGRKMQTRRIMKPQPQSNGVLSVMHMGRDCFRIGALAHAAIGDDWHVRYSVGDRLWVREAWSGPHHMGDIPPRAWVAGLPVWYWADGSPDDGDWTAPKPSIHMPRRASRLTLIVTDVRVERLQDISEADAVAEGITTIWPDGPRDDGGPNHYTVDVDHCHLNGPTATTVYRMLWDWINGPDSWDANPWVWVIEFKKLEQQEAA